MTNVLFSWVGGKDLEKLEKNDEPCMGPLARAVLEREFDEIHVANTYPTSRTGPYLTWLRSQCDKAIVCDEVKLKTVVDYGDISRFVHRKLTGLREQHPDMTLTIHLTPGTPAMSQVSLLIGATQYSAKFLQSSKEQGLTDVVIPFNISAEFIPQLLKKSEQSLFDRAMGDAPISPEFSAIIGESSQIKDAIRVAEKFAPFKIPVLILGESGTGKELFANAIAAGNRDRDPDRYKSENCGSLTDGTINSKLFGHVKGAFTGAVKPEDGLFKEADGGTVFLDEFGELPLETQVRLLRVLQEKKITPVGSNEEIKVDVRVIAATNIDLPRAIAENRFRADLYHRVAVGVIYLPPLREREGDINVLTQYFMETIREEHDFKKKKTLSPKAINAILGHDWPGNVRELENALTRAYVLSDGDIIDHHVMAKSIVRVPNASRVDFQSEAQATSPKTLNNMYISLEHYINELQKVHIKAALEMEKHNKTKAAERLGLKSQQVITKRMEKLGIEG